MKSESLTPELIQTPSVPDPIASIWDKLLNLPEVPVITEDELILLEYEKLETRRLGGGVA